MDSYVHCNVHNVSSMINTVGHGACEKSMLFSENTQQSFKTHSLAGYSPASCHAGSREVIPIFLLWAGQASSCRPSPEFWQHSEQTHNFKGHSSAPPCIGGWQHNEDHVHTSKHAQHIVVGIWLLHVCEDSLIQAIWQGDHIQWWLHSDEHIKIY